MALVYAYKCTRQTTTGVSPYFLMFHRRPRIAVNIMFGLQSCASSSTLTKYVNNLKSRLKSAYALAKSDAKIAYQTQKKNYHLKIRVQPGDRVLV